MIDAVVNPIVPGWQLVSGLLEAVLLTVVGFAALIIVLGTLFLLVRFLLVGTRAARIYIANHEPPRASRPFPTPSDVREPSVSPAEPTGTTTKPARTKTSTSRKAPPPPPVGDSDTQTLAEAPTEPLPSSTRKRPPSTPIG